MPSNLGDPRSRDLLSLVGEGVSLTTEQYTRLFDPVRYEMLGVDCSNPRYDLSRLGLRAEDANDDTLVYDFEKVRAVERLLIGVDRRRALRAIVSRLTAGMTTDTQAHVALLKFLQKSHFHNYVHPLYPDGTDVADPLVLLELGEMWCGQVSRIAIDLWSSTGKPARLVQLGGHQIAELYYEDKWHYCDPAIFENGATVFDAEGSIPSVIELSQPANRHKLDRFRMYNRERDPRRGPKLGCRNYASYFYFSKRAYTTPPRYYVKTATPEQELNFRYGWDRIQIVEDTERVLYHEPPRFEPGAVALLNVRHDPAASILRVTFSPATDPDNDLLGYRVFVSHISRGWDYSQFWGTENASAHRSIPNGWHPQMYEKMQQVPPHEVALIQTADTHVDIPVQSGKTYFVTVMPFDAHGESVGRELYAMSNEIKVEVG